MITKLFTVASVLALQINFQATLSSPTPTVPDQPTKVRRDSLDDAVSLFPSSLQSAISNGISPEFFTKIPTSTSDLEQVMRGAASEHPVELLNLPGYARFSNDRWNLHIHGQAYTRPYLSLPESRQNDIADLFVTDTDTAKLPQNEQNNARNLTSHVLLYPAQGLDLVLDIYDDGRRIDSARMPRTDSRGEYDVWYALPEAGLPDGSSSGGPVGTIEYRTDFTDSGNATGYLIPNEGITIVSDVDDLLRVTEIWDPQEALLNTFARDFRAWMNMPDVYNGWASSSTGNNSYHFHYLTTTPQQASKAYMSFVYSTYPLGSFDTRPLNFSNSAAVFSPREFLLQRILRTFPDRKFVLIGDTSNNDIMRTYPSIATEFSGQVQCILIRNISATEPDNFIPYNTKSFESLKSDTYMFFRTPDDIANLEFSNGDCVNPNIPQNLTFEWQGGPGGSWQSWIQRQSGGSNGVFLRADPWGVFAGFAITFIAYFI